MATSNQVSTMAKLAKQIADKEMKTGETNSEELLEALGNVAKMLEAQAGNNHEVSALAKQVQELVAAKVTK